MAKVMESVATINSAIRTLLALFVVGLASVAGYFGYAEYNKADLALKEKDKELEQRAARIAALESDLEIAKARVEKLETAMRLLKVDHRLANIDVLDQGTDEEGKTFTDVAFTEINDNNEPIGDTQKFRLTGKKMHVSGWIVKFDDRFVEAGDPERGASLFVFKSIYGEEQKPIDGFPLDQPGQRPGAYGSSRKMSDFEKQIWDDFWDLAHDRKRAEALGVRASQGTSVYMEARKGWRYQIRLRASDDLTLLQQGEVPANK